MKLAAPVDLTVPLEGSTTFRGIYSLALRRLLRDLLGLRPPGMAAATQRALEEARNRWRSLASSNPGALAAAVQSPGVGALVRCLRLRPRVAPAQVDGLVKQLIANVYAELAAIDGLPGPVRLDVLPPFVICQRTGMLWDLEGARCATFTKHGIDVEPHAVEPTLVLHPVRDGITLACADDNPISSEEAHPDKDGNALALGGKEPEAWIATLGEAFDLIARYLPALADEMRLALRRVVPVGYDDHTHLSASYQEAIGTAYMSLHPNVMTMAEALIHEFSHNKLYALFELDRGLDNAFSPLFSSPVRPDPRPLHGILLAVHAFLPVERLYDEMAADGHGITRDPGFARRHEHIRTGNREGAGVLLENARVTPVGQGLLDEIARLIA